MSCINDVVYSITEEAASKADFQRVSQNFIGDGPIGHLKDNTMKYLLPPFQNYVLTLVFMSIQNGMLITAYVKDLLPYLMDCKTMSLDFTPYIQDTPYVSEENDLILRQNLHAAFYNKVYDELIYPMRCSILTQVGEPNGSLLSQSDEIKWKIIGYLNMKDRSSLAQTCRHFHMLYCDQASESAFQLQ